MRKVLYILSRLTDTDIEWLAGAGVRRQVPPGFVLVEQGEPVDALIFVLDGEVAVTVRGIGEMARLGVGEILGEMSFVDRNPPSATVTATTQTQILVIDRDLVASRVEADPAFAARFYHAIAMFLSSRLRNTMQKFGEEGVDAHEALNLDVLENVHVAGAHFDRMIKRLLSV